MISTHALTWSATIQKTLAVGLASDFNSRTHVECDRLILNVNHVAKISTHALTWSATVPMGTDVFSVQISTHALTWSATALQMQLTRYGTFQLTHSRGVRPTSPDSLHSPKNFNSRTHVECDGAPRPPIKMPVYFNSRTHVECDDFEREISFVKYYFNSRTHVECDWR